LKVELLNITQNPCKLLEKIASISYVTQRFSEKIREKSVKFSSGRIVPISQIKNSHLIEVGKSIVGFTKDDGIVEKILSDSSENVVRFLKRIGHFVPFEMCTVTFLLSDISRKAALHLLRYRHTSVNMRSQKYLSQNQFEYVLPSKASNTNDESLVYYKECMEKIQMMYERFRDIYQWDPEDARLVLPNSAEQTMIYHTNFRELFHLFDIMCSESYVSEIHDLGIKILKLVKEKEPIIFEDFEFYDDKGIFSAKRNRCKGCNVHVNYSLSDKDKENLGITER
jgi:thymidylate synthase (FAD)